jgi:ABC-type amino acid transport substrate-binding protein
VSVKPALLAAGLIGARGPAPAADLEILKTRGSLRVLVCATASPEFFNLKEAGEPGFDREILEAFAARHRLQVEVETVPTWADLEVALLAERGDVIAGHYTATPQRRKLLAFTGEVFPTRAVILTRAPEPVIKTWGQLVKRRVGTTRGTSHYETLLSAGFPSKQLVMVPADPSARIQALRAGQIDAAPFGVAEAMLVARQDPALQMGMFIGLPGSQALAVRPQDRELLRALDEHVAQLRRTPRWGQLVVKYFGARALEILKLSRER